MSRALRPPSEAGAQTWEAEDDDMAEGDLGYGLGRRPGGIYEVPVSHLVTSRRRSDETNCSPPPFPRKGEERSGAVCQRSRPQDTYREGPRTPHHRRHSSTDSNSELPNVELKQRLDETLELRRPEIQNQAVWPRCAKAKDLGFELQMAPECEALNFCLSGPLIEPIGISNLIYKEVENLKTELEASQRQLEGKEAALKILQSMAIFGKATSHTQAVFQKTVDEKRSLEKEINALQWKIEFDQNRIKNIEETWTQKYDRLNCENAVLKETLKLKTEEIKMLKSENASLNQQYLEALAMLEIKQQKMVQENTCDAKSDFTEFSGLEVACGPWSLPLSWSWREPLFLCQNGGVCSEKDSSAQTRGSLSQRTKKTLGQKLLGMLPAENSSKKTEDQDNPQEVFKMLIDLLNDKEEALAHQRKVSYMLARALEDKDIGSRENKEENPMKDNFPLKHPKQKTSEFSVLHDPVHSSVHIFNSVGCVCSIQHLHTDKNYRRTLKRSHSLPRNIIF
ncbi:coiled-coil domain-containing protein 125 isoform X4 [Myotis lucifugus]|uniref:coiled-coil domain-containing protein 125 isoform X4 n=1 Tax=Myotis lucifugus TaxID=59463 RepID=UPI000CCC5E01|nr:coiled-coil domain-containing protein 125 isoform X4 [Myotis lucifugus]